GVRAHRCRGRDRRERRRQSCRQTRYLEPDLRHADLGCRQGEERHRDEAQHEPGLCWHRERAVLRRQHAHAVRRCAQVAHGARPAGEGGGVATASMAPVRATRPAGRAARGRRVESGGRTGYLLRELMLRPHPTDSLAAQSAVRLQGVARRFGDRWVLRGVDLDIAPGEVVALTGRNGSGKTTLLRIIATLLRPTRGAATVFGHDTVREPDPIRARVGFLGHRAGLYDHLTAAENLIFSLRMAGRVADPAAVGAALARVRLTDARDERVRGFSAGMQRRLGLARLLLRPPSVLLLDEPYASFDSDGVDLVNEFASE